MFNIKPSGFASPACCYDAYGKVRWLSDGKGLNGWVHGRPPMWIERCPYCGTEYESLVAEHAVFSARGDVLCGADAVVIPVNCVGVMGKGLALTFARRHRTMAATYMSACKGDNAMRPGEICVVEAGQSTTRGIKTAIFVATKDHWRKPSRAEWVRQGIESIIACGADYEFNTIAIPALGCGRETGTLSWSTVGPILHGNARRMKLARRVLLFEPVD